jgi:hypothetical protein
MDENIKLFPKCFYVQGGRGLECTTTLPAQLENPDSSFFFLSLFVCEIELDDVEMTLWISIDCSKGRDYIQQRGSNASGTLQSPGGTGRVHTNGLSALIRERPMARS